MRINVISLCAAFMILLTGTTTFAAPGGNCEAATVLRVGAFNTGDAIELRNDSGEDFTNWVAGTNKWLVLHPDNADAMLATALTAFSLGKQLTVVAPNADYVGWGYATQIFVSN